MVGIKPAWEIILLSYLSALLVTVLASLLAAFAALLAHRLIPFDIRRGHHDVGSVVFLQLGVVFAVLLAFVFSEDWSQYNQADQAINLEVSSIHGLAMIAATLTPENAAPILKLEVAYLKSVVSREWQVMAGTRKGDDETEQKFRFLVDGLANFKSADSAEHDKKGAMLSLITEAHTQRETRLYQAQSGIPLPLWCVLIGYTIILGFFVTFAAIQYVRIAVATSVCFAAGIVSILVIARLLDYPFEGALALGPEDFIELTDKVSKLIAGLNTPER